MKAVIHKILHHSVVDGPGNRAVIFFQGCNFRCAYCHNPETLSLCRSCGECVKKCPAGALKMREGRVIWDQEKCCGCDACIHVCPHLSSPKTREYTPKQVMEELEEDLSFLRGITVSGGECSLWRPFVRELFALARQKGLSTLMDSNGSWDYAEDEELLSVCDGVMLDIKALDERAHRELTGNSNRVVLKNAVFLAQNHKLEEIRTVVVPDVLQAEDTIAGIGELLKPYLKEQSIRYKLIAYRAFGVRSPYREIFRSPDTEEMEALGRLAKEKGFRDVVII